MLFCSRLCVRRARSKSLWESADHRPLIARADRSTPSGGRVIAAIWRPQVCLRQTTPSVARGQARGPRPQGVPGNSTGGLQVPHSPTTNYIHQKCLTFCMLNAIVTSVISNKGA